MTEAERISDLDFIRRMNNSFVKSQNNSEINIKSKQIRNNNKFVSLDLLSRIESNNLHLEDITIDALNLSTRSHNALTRSGIYTVRELVCLTVSDLAKMYNVGVKSLQEIEKNTNEYLKRIAKPEETERFFKVSLLELIQMGEINVDSVASASLANPSLDRQFLEPLPIQEIVTNNDLLDRLLHLGLSSSLDMWVLAFGHYLNIDAIFGESLKEMAESVAGKWQTGRTTDFQTNIKAIQIPCNAENVPIDPDANPYNHYLSDCVKAELVIKASPSSTVHWEAILPNEGLTQKIDWVNCDDKTTGLCIFLKQIAKNSVVHWADPSVTNWERLPRSRAVDAFYDWISSIKIGTYRRDYQIFEQWFGLKSGERSTLEKVGDKYNISRERVRQIVNHFLKLLLHPSRKKYLTPFISYFDMLFKKHGGIMTLKEIVNSSVFFEEFDGLSSLQAAELLLVGCNKYNVLDYNPIKDKLSGIELGWITWNISEINPEEIKRTREIATQLVRNEPLRYDSDELVDLVISVTNIDKEVVRASLRTYQDLKNGRLGYSHLANGEKRLTTNQMAIVALRELLVPARCSVIHKKICEIFPDQKVDIGTLRNALNKGQFRIIERGIYGLLESNQQR